MSTIDDELAAVKGYGDEKAPGEQGTSEWLYQRKGLCTGSRFKDVLDFQKSGKEGAKRAAYRIELVIERLTGRPVEHFVSAEMLWGTEMEPMARMAYESHTGSMVAEAHFIAHPTIPLCGGSVDGLVDEDGMIEIKCPKTSTHINTMLSRECEHLPQIQGYMAITGRKWCDFISFDPRMPDALQLYVQRLYRDAEYIAKLEAEILKFLVEVSDMESSLRDMASKQ
jgi:predicted phage-related endonuclease